ncbi:MAG: TetR family transcriptional regulator, partial [Pseudomonadota bacterium]
AADEKNRNEIFRLWAKTGYPFSDYVDDYKGDKLIKRLNPLLTDYYYASLQKSIAETKQYKFTRRDVPYEGWVEPKYLNNALKAQNLVGFWDNNDANGKPLPKR